MFPGADQEHIGCLPAECPKGGGAFQVGGGAHDHQNPLTRWLHWLLRVREVVAGRKGGRVDGIGRGVVWGGAPTSTDRLCWYEKVPTAEVVFRPVCHPKHWEGVPPG